MENWVGTLEFGVGHGFEVHGFLFYSIYPRSGTGEAGTSRKHHKGNTTKENNKDKNKTSTKACSLEPESSGKDS